MPVAAGETFAGYTIVELLGSGSMGEVYLVQHPVESISPRERQFELS
ncbi:MAG: hypothetical protein K0U84_02630 [Actinomycetia bacterium]|nr:hypothetical protein [Actinomycetes bacterium]